MHCVGCYTGNGGDGRVNGILYVRLFVFGIVLLSVFVYIAFGNNGVRAESDKIRNRMLCICLISFVLLCWSR